MQIINLTKSDFISKISNISSSSSGWHYKGLLPSVVVFHALWCPHCKALSPTLDLLAQEYDGRVDIYKVEIEQQSDIASAFAIESIPTLMFIPMDGIPQIVQGAMPLDEIRRMIDEIIL